MIWINGLWGRRRVDRNQCRSRQSRRAYLQRRIITGADLLGRRLRGIATLEARPSRANSVA